MTSRILITGGNGFLGQSILSRLLKSGKDEIYTMSRSDFKYQFHRKGDLLDIKRLREILDEVRPDVVYHIAANPNTKPDDLNPSAIIRDNVEGTNNLLHCLKDRPKVVFASSVTVFGVFNKGLPCAYASSSNPISVYSTTKLACENLINTYSRQDKIDGYSIRIPALTGVKATHGLVKDLIRKVESNDKVLNLIGNDPGTIKPFCHVDEIAKIFCDVGRKFEVTDYNRMIIVGNNDSMSVKDIAEIVMTELGKKKEIVWSGQTWPGDNLEIWIHPDITPPSNSPESITKVVREYKNGG